MCLFPCFRRFGPRLPSGLFGFLGLAALLPLPLLADYYSSNSSDGYASFDSGFSGNHLTVRAGDTRVMTAGMGTTGAQFIDYGTSIAGVDAVVSAPWWLDPNRGGLAGNFGPDNATVQFISRGDHTVYFHLTFFSSYAEANIGFFTVTVHGSYTSFSSLPSSISQGDNFTAVAMGQDDDGLLASVITQVSVNGGAWSTLSIVGRGNGWVNSTAGVNMSAGTAGTTYQFRAWTTDANSYQSNPIYSPVYTTQAPPPATAYFYMGTDIGNLFKPLNGAAKAAPTGLTCMINGTRYDLSDLFLPRVSAPRGNVGFTAANGQDIAQIFEQK